MNGKDLALVCLALAFLSRASASIEYTFHTSEITPFTYGDVINTTVVKNKMACMLTCSLDGSCRSVTFDPAGNNTCTTNRWADDISGFLCGTGCASASTVLYAPKPMKSTMRLACRTSWDCVDPQSECRLSQCLCKAGYSYHGTSFACVHGCSSYGTTFQPDLNSVTMYDNQRIISGVWSLTACKSYCINEASFVCKTIEPDLNSVTMFDNQRIISGVWSLTACKSYCINEASFVCKTIEVSGSTCILQDYTALDKWGIYRSNFTGWDLYTRYCA